MKKKELVNSFITLLKDYNVLTAFIVNLSREDERPLFTYLNQTYADSWVQKSFSWSDTEEGLTFWDAIDDQWLNYIGVPKFDW